MKIKIQGGPKTFFRSGVIYTYIMSLIHWVFLFFFFFFEALSLRDAGTNKGLSLILIWVLHVQQSLSKDIVSSPPI